MSGAQPRAPARSALPAALRAGFGRSPDTAALRAGDFIADIPILYRDQPRAGRVVRFCPLLRRVHSNQVPQILLRRRAVSFNPLRRPWSSARDAAG